MYNDMKDVTLLTSQEFVRNAVGISDNVAAGYMLPAIMEAQDVRLRSILGSALLRRLVEMVKDKTIKDAGNEAYKDLVDRCQWVLAYQATVEIIARVSYKIGNFGVMRSHDERAESATFDEIILRKSELQSKADYHVHLLQCWLLDNRQAFAELDECQCRCLSSNLRTSATCGIFLG